MYKNMRQEWVFMAQGSEEDVLRGKVYWKILSDPFPTWEQNA